METKKGVMSWKILKPTLSIVERTTDERTEVASLQCHQFPELGVHLIPIICLPMMEVEALTCDILAA